jgi:hypothetical protein
MRCLLLANIGRQDFSWFFRECFVFGGGSSLGVGGGSGAGTSAGFFRSVLSSEEEVRLGLVADLDVKRRELPGFCYSCFLVEG